MMKNTLGDSMFAKYLTVFFISMVPLIELRGAIPVALGMDLPAIPAIIVCCVGNMIPVPFIYFFARKFLIWGAKQKYMGKFCNFFLEKGQRAGEKLVRKQAGAAWRQRWRCLLAFRCPVPAPGPEPWVPAFWIWDSSLR